MSFKHRMSSSNSGSSGIGFVGLLTIAFIVLKLTNSITWSWIWVLSPIWISAMLVLNFLALCALVFIIKEIRHKATMKALQKERNEQQIYRDVQQCSSCGMPHYQMHFTPLGNARGTYTHTAHCPKTQRLVYMRFT